MNIYILIFIVFDQIYKMNIYIYIFIVFDQIYKINIYTTNLSTKDNLVSLSTIGPAIVSIF